MKKSLYKAVFILLLMVFTSCVQSVDDHRSSPLNYTWKGDFEVTLNNDRTAKGNTWVGKYLFDDEWLLVYSGREIKIFGTYTIMGNSLIVHQHQQSTLYFQR